jgi:N-acetylneuraminic acid mutarotase
MGGFSNNGCNTNSIEVYNIDNNKWTLHETKLPRKLAQCSAIYLNKDDSILIIGGNENPYVLWKYVLKFKL